MTVGSSGREGGRHGWAVDITVGSSGREGGQHGWALDMTTFVAIEETKWTACKAITSKKLAS